MYYAENQGEEKRLQGLIYTQVTNYIFFVIYILSPLVEYFIKTLINTYHYY